MVFKRREKRSWLRVVAESFWPRGGWGRAFQYIQHRLRRLPDTPDRIARGIFAGVFASFTPFFGLHFLTAFIIAKLMRGNVLASLLATFFGNPITFPFIATLSTQSGYLILGLDRKGEHAGSLLAKFNRAMGELWFNLRALFTDADAHWEGLSKFYTEVFLPYMVGGLVPGIIAGVVAYYVSLPLITAYQNRRKGRLKKTLEKLRRKKAAKKPAGDTPKAS